jgi:hypothetical protein
MELQSSPSLPLPFCAKIFPTDGDKNRALKTVIILAINVGNPWDKLNGIALSMIVIFKENIPVH